MRPKILFLFALLLLAACGAPAGPAPTPPPIAQPPVPRAEAAPPPLPTPTLLPPLPADHNGLLYIELPPGGTPEADPTVTLTAYIIDSVTEAPVVATVYLYEDLFERSPQPDDRLAANVTGFALELPAVYSGHLVVRADGYHEWNFVLQHRVKTSRVMTLPVRMERVTGEEI